MLEGREYDVFFNNGNKIEFDRKGNWQEIDCEKGSSVPLAVLPDDIVSFLNGNYAERRVTDVSKDRNGYEITLDNGVELKFDSKNRFLGFD